MYINKKLFDIQITKEAVEIAEKFGISPFMAQRYIMFMGDKEAIEYLISVEKGIEKSFRCNSILVKDCNVVERSLTEKGFILEKTPYLNYAYYIKREPFSIGSTVEHLSGKIYVQGVGSMLASEVLSPVEDDKVVDMAAAPGGKTTHMAQLMKNKGIILSIDINRERIWKLRVNIERLNAKNVYVLRTDALKINGLDEYFDKVMLDAPCTGEGLIVYKKERKFSKGIEDYKKMIPLQISMLKKAFKLLKRGGKILYSTCSIAPEENEYVISQVLNELKD
ncbi:MAG: RsmB/NOP family class I SAM-dependent RNA methyltransferase, partial [Fervidicoccus fontis]